VHIGARGWCRPNCAKERRIYSAVGLLIPYTLACSYLLHQCLKRTNMIVLSFRSVAGEITKIPTTRVPPPCSNLLIGPLNSRIGEGHAPKPCPLVYADIMFRALCAPWGRVFANKTSFLLNEPPDRFELPYEPYEDPVLPLYDEGIDAYIHDLKHHVPFPSDTVAPYNDIS